MKTRIEKTYVSNIFGFPVVIQNAPMRSSIAGWVLDVPPNILEETVLRALAHKRSPLTGNQIRFIRQHFGMTLSEFGERFDLTHPGVLAWEKCGPDPTSMKWPIEKDIRLFILSQLLAPTEELANTYRELERRPAVNEDIEGLEIPGQELAG